ncbi:MAG: methyltransferase domain-containing protein [Chloroflexi bacterium]|nr:methyltransferase domain-containing protein [Chloroflexota bacterium]MCL5275808.1 methyltransferase domain-containing protein [Chloroflexota bacterium]
MTDQKQTVQDQFGANAENYARSTLFAGGESLADMVRLVQPASAWNVLDVATGGGHCACAFAPLVKHVTATDITERMLQAAERVARERELLNIRFEKADAEALPYSDDRFDLVTCRIAAHHFSEPGQAVREMARVCKPGGLVAVIDGIAPNNRTAADEVNAWETWRDPSHVALLTVNGWSSLFCAAELGAVHLARYAMELDFDDHMRRAGCDARTTAKVRDGLLNGSPAMRDWLRPRVNGDKIALIWRLILIVGRKTLHGHNYDTQKSDFCKKSDFSTGLG